MLPNIPGVEFKLIAEFPGYGVSSDGQIWIGKRGKWRPMQPYLHITKQLVVKIKNDRASWVIPIDILVKSAFEKINLWKEVKKCLND